MVTRLSFLIFTFFLTACFLNTDLSFASDRDIPETDNVNYSMYSFFDLRDRETYVQVTNTANPDFVGPGMFDVSGDITVHVQIFNVDDNCNENNFFDTLTPFDTHIYNMRDIQTNNGSPSGVVLPDDSYGFVVISAVDPQTLIIDVDGRTLIGNFRILDDSGYEYRTNSNGQETNREFQDDDRWANFNTLAGVTLSDVVIIVTDDDNSFSSSNPSVEASNILDAWKLYEVDIYDLNENVFSCRNVMAACVTQDHPLYQELLEEPGDDDDDSAANVASFEYGINDAIPHSKGGEVLCPGNTISEGFINIDQITNDGDLSAIFIGLNNGNGRGSMDSWWSSSGI